MPAFDPDAFLAEESSSAVFDPDAFLAETTAFDPDAFLADGEQAGKPAPQPGRITPVMPAAPFALPGVMGSYRGTEDGGRQTDNGVRPFRPVRDTLRELPGAVDEFLTEDTYAGLQAGYHLTSLADIIPGLSRGMAHAGAAIVQGGQKAANKLTGRQDALGPTQQKIVDAFMDAADNKYLTFTRDLKQNVAQELADAALEKGGKPGRATSEIVNVVADTVQSLAMLKGAKIGYGGGAGASGNLAKQTLGRLQQAQKIAAFRFLTTEGNPDSQQNLWNQKADAYLLTSLYMSTPAVSGWMKTPAGAKVLDVALNSLISIGGKVYQDSMAAAEARALSEGRPEDAGFEKLLAAAGVLGMDVVFGAMTKPHGRSGLPSVPGEFKDAVPPEVREQFARTVEERRAIIKQREAGVEQERKEMIRKAKAGDPAAKQWLKDMLGIPDGAEAGGQRAEVGGQRAEGSQRPAENLRSETGESKPDNLPLRPGENGQGGAVDIQRTTAVPLRSEIAPDQVPDAGKMIPDVLPQVEVPAGFDVKPPPTGTKRYYRAEAGRGGFLPMTDSIGVAAAYERGGTLGGDENAWEREFNTGNEARTRSRVVAYDVDDTNTLDLTDFRTGKYGLNAGWRVLAELDAKGNDRAQEIIDNAKTGAFGYFWEMTKGQRYLPAWEKVLIPQLREQGYEFLRYRDDAGTGITLAALGRDVLKRAEQQPEEIINYALSALDKKQPIRDEVVKQMAIPIKGKKYVLRDGVWYFEGDKPAPQQSAINNQQSAIQTTEVQNETNDGRGVEGGGAAQAGGSGIPAAVLPQAGRGKGGKATGTGRKAKGFKDGQVVKVGKSEYVRSGDGWVKGYQGKIALDSKGRRQVVRRPELIAEIEQRPGWQELKAQVKKSEAETRALQNQADAAAFAFYNQNPVLARVLREGGILMPERKGFEPYPDEYAAIPRDFRGKVHAATKKRSGLPLDEHADQVGMDDEALRELMIAAGAQADRIREAVLAGLPIPVQNDLRVLDGVAEAMLHDMQRGVMPPTDLIDEYPEVYRDLLKIHGISERSLHGTDALADEDYYPVEALEGRAELEDEAYAAYVQAQDAASTPKKPVMSFEQWQRENGLAPAPQTEEMFGKGAVGDAFTLRSEVVKSKESFAEKQAREAREEAQEKAQTNMFQGAGRGGAQASPGGKMDDNLGAANEAADNPEFSSLPFEMPELVQLAEMLPGGRVPQVRKQLRALKGEAAGVFHGIEGRGPVDIQLRADIFRLISPAEQMQMARESAEYAAERQKLDGLSDAETAALAKAVFQKRYDELHRERMKQDPIQARKTLAHEIMHWIDFVPQNLMHRGNLFGHIGAFTKYYKNMMASVPAEQNMMLTEQDRRGIRRAAEKQVGPRPPKDEEAERAAWGAEVSRVYAEMIQEEAEARGLVTRAELIEELKPLIAWWNGSDFMPEYYSTPEEMFAEAGSVFLNNPAAVAKRAPLYFNMLHNWMETRPEVKAVYQKMQEAIRTGAIYPERVRRLRDAFRQGDEQLFMVQDQGGKKSKRERKDAFVFTFDRVFGPVFTRMREAGVSGERYGRIHSAIENYLYRATGHEAYMGRVSQEVMAKLYEQDLHWEDLAEFMFHKRVINERADMANPLGFTAKSSTERLGEMAATMGPQGYAALEQAHEALWTIRRDMVFPMLEQSGLFTPELLKQIEDNMYYATFAVNRNPDGGTQGSIEEMLLKTYGSNIGAKIYKQIGTLQRIMDPGAATIAKDLSLMDAARRNVLKGEIVDLLSREFPNEIKQAEKQWNGTRNEIVMRDGERVGTLVVMRDGVPEGWYVPRVFVEAFEMGNPIEVGVIMHSLSAGSRAIKNVMTQLNYGFWPVAWSRDIMGYYAKMPRLSNLPFGGPQYWRHFREAFADSWSSVMGSPNAGALQSLTQQDWITVANPLASKDENAAIDRLMRRYWQNPAKRGEDVKLIDQALGVLTKWMELGQVLERTSKRAGRLYLDRNFPDMPEWKKQFYIHNAAGSPNFLSKGAGNMYLDFVGLFYNPWKESVRAVVERTKEDPATMAWNAAKFAVSPKVIMWLFASGAMVSIMKAAFGDDGEEFAKDVEEMFKYIPEYDKTNYTIIPLGWNDKETGKVLYLRLPLAEELRIASGLTWKVLNKDQNIQQSLNYMGGQLPVGNPIWEVPINWAQYLSGNNPYDWFRGQPLLTDDLAGAKDWRGTVAMGKYTWNSFGGGIIHRMDVNNYGESPDRTKLEKILDAPVISNLMGRWLKVSNRGYADSLRQQVSEPLRQAQARSRLNAKDALRGGDFMSITNDPRAVEYLMNNAGDYMLRRSLRPEESMLYFAPSKEEQVRLMEAMGR